MTLRSDVYAFPRAVVAVSFSAIPILSPEGTFASERNDQFNIENVGVYNPRFTVAVDGFSFLTLSLVAINGPIATVQRGAAIMQ